MIRFICKSYLSYRWMIRRKIFHPSLDRLAKLSAVDPSDPARLQAAADEFSRILQNLRLRGIWKWTGQNRLRRIDQLLAAQVRTRGSAPGRMLDIGASDGITTLDTVAFLRAETGIEVSATVIDRDTRLLRFRIPGGALYASPSLRPVLVRWGRIGLYLEPMDGLEGLLFNRLAAALSRRYASILARADLSSATPVPTVNPAVAHCPSIEVIERDLFEPEPRWFGAFDVVRASNVLVLSYYTPERITEALGIAHRYLKEGGALLVSRNVIGAQDEREIGGLWIKRGGRFVRGSALDELPEIAGLIEGYRS